MVQLGGMDQGQGILLEDGQASIGAQRLLAPLMSAHDALLRRLRQDGSRGFWTISPMTSTRTTTTVMQRSSMLPGGTAASRFSAVASHACSTASRHVWALLSAVWHSNFWRTWTATIMMATVGMFVCFSGLYLFVQSGSTRQIDSLFELSQGLDNSINVAELELDSDEYEFEEDDSDRVMQDATSAGFARPLRRVFSLGQAHGHDESAKSKDGVAVKRHSSLVRITSSDPSSSLSSSPIQLELDTRGGVSSVISNAPTSAMAENGVSSSVRQSRPGSAASSASSSSSLLAARRRKESGKLANNGSPSRQQRTARLPGRPHHDSTSRIASPKRASVNLANREGTRNPLHDLQQRAGDGSGADVPLLSSSPTSMTSSCGSPESVDEDGKAIALAPRSILKRNQELWLSLPEIANSLPSPNGQLYPSSQGAFPSLAWSGSEHMQGFPPSVRSDGSNSARQAPSNPSPLPAQPPPQAPNSSSHSASDRPPVPPPPPASFYSRLPPGARLPSFRAAAPRLGTLSPAQARAAWPSQRIRSIKLVEPSWEPYVEVHERARERQETAAKLASGHPRAASTPNLPFLPWDETDSESESGSEMDTDEKRRVNAINVEMRRAKRASRQMSSADEAEFWFERYTRSTAAAGKDWDWRKRRARQRAQAMQMAAAASAMSISDEQQLQNQPNGARRPPPPLPLNGVTSRAANEMSQRSEGGSPSWEGKRRSSHPQPPLISFSASELPRRPNLDIDTSSSIRRDQQGGGRTSPSKPANTNDEKASPLTKAIKSLWNGNGYPEGSQPSSPIRMDSGAQQLEGDLSTALLAQRGSSPQPGSGSTLRLRKGVTKMMNNRSSGPEGAGPMAENALETSNGSLGSPKRSRRYSETDTRASDGDSSTAAPSLPSRISSLSPRNRLNSLRGGAKKGRNPILASQLLEEAEGITTTDSRGAAEDRESAPNGMMPKGALGLRRSRSSGSIPSVDASDQRPIEGTGNGTEGGGWSSADAYGAVSSASPRYSTSPQIGGIQAAGVFEDTPVFLASPSDYGADDAKLGRMSSRNSNRGAASEGAQSAPNGHGNSDRAFPMFKGGEAMMRKSSTRDSLSSEGNPPVMIPARRSTASRKGILSSASTAAAASASPANPSPNRTTARRDSMGRAMTEAFSPKPMPAVQPEPAPLQMAKRARSASVTKQEAEAALSVAR